MQKYCVKEVKIQFLLLKEHNDVFCCFLNLYSPVFYIGIIQGSDRHASCNGTGIPEEKKFKVRSYRGLRLSSTCALGWLTNECFAFTSSSTFIPHKLKSPTKLLQEFDRVEDAFIFYWTMLTQSYMSCGFVKLLVLCDQVWLSHWTRLPVKPEPVVKFSLKWKGNTVCLPKVWITI